MVGVQFVMSISFSILSPIMPLFLPELGVVSREAVDVWAGVLASITSFVAIFTAPLWGSLADRYGRKLMVLRSTLGICDLHVADGPCAEPLAHGGISRRHGGAGRVQFRRDAAGVHAGAGTPAGLFAGMARHGPIGGIADRPDHRWRGVADLTGSYRIPFFFAGVISLVAFARHVVVRAGAFHAARPGLGSAVRCLPASQS